MQVCLSYRATVCTLLHKPPGMSSAPPPAPIDVQQQLPGQHHLRMPRLQRLHRSSTVGYLAHGDVASTSSAKQSNHQGRFYDPAKCHRQLCFSNTGADAYLSEAKARCCYTARRFRCRYTAPQFAQPREPQQQSSWLSGAPPLDSLLGSWDCVSVCKFSFAPPPLIPLRTQTTPCFAQHLWHLDSSSEEGD